MNISNVYLIILVTTASLVLITASLAAYKKGGFSNLNKFSMDGLYFGLFAGLVTGTSVGITGSLITLSIGQLIVWISIFIILGLFTGWKDEFRQRSKTVIKID